MPIRPWRLRATVLLVIALGWAFPAAAQVSLYPDLEGTALRAALRADFAPALTLGYGPARDSLYAYEQRTFGAVCGIYTGFCAALTPGTDPSTDAFGKGINAEHTWPQSRGAESEPQRSDLHALFPAKDNVNSSRGNHPYAEVPDAEADGWYRLDQSQSTVPAVLIDEWSEKDNAFPGTAYPARFEPRESASGDVARAAAYFAALYEGQVDAYGERGFLTIMLADLVAWNDEDPPDAAERARSAWIAEKQGAENPFVLDPTLLARAFGDYDENADPDEPTGGEPSDPGAVWVNELHYDNAGTDEGEFVEVAGVAGTDLAGWRLVLYNGDGGAVYDDRALDGTIDNEADGLGAVAFTYPPNGIQNGSPDGLALVDPSGAVVQFLSYEGVVVATDGPAAGRTSTDIGVRETGTTAVGQSVALIGTGRSYRDFAWAGPSAATPGSLAAGQAAAPATDTEDGPSPHLLVSVHPNPTAGPATVRFALVAPSDVRLDVFDALGRHLRTAKEGPRPAGFHATLLDLSGLPPGVYAVRVDVGDAVAVRLVTVAR